MLKLRAAQVGYGAWNTVWRIGGNKEDGGGDGEKYTTCDPSCYDAISTRWLHRDRRFEVVFKILVSFFACSLHRGDHPTMQRSSYFSNNSTNEL